MSKPKQKMKDRYLIYEVPCSEEQYDDLFLALDPSGISSARYQRGVATFTFGFICGCETCPRPKTAKKARKIVQRRLRQCGVSWRYLGAKKL